MLINKQNNLAF